MAFLYSREDLGLQANWKLIAARELAQNIGKVDVRPMSQRSFLADFGVLPVTVMGVHYQYLLDSDHWHPKYLLWTLSFLKNYEVDGVSNQKFARCNQRYFRDRVWQVIFLLTEEMNEVFFLFYSCLSL
jgi:hypothetical protein